MSAVAPVTQLDLIDQVNDRLEKAQAIIQLMGCAERADIVPDGALEISSLAATELIREAMVAAALMFKQLPSNVPETGGAA